MIVHGNAKLGPAGRLALTQAIADGMTQKAAAAAFCVSPATAHRWWHRRLTATREELGSGVWLLDRSSRPHRSPRLLDAAAQERICEARQRTGLGTEARRRRDRLPALDGLEGAPPSRALAPSAPATRRRPPVRVAVPRRPAAHGHRPLRTVRAARASRHRRSLATQPQLDGRRHPGRLRLRARDRRRPLPPGVRRAAR